MCAKFVFATIKKLVRATKVFFGSAGIVLRSFLYKNLWLFKIKFGRFYVRFGCVAYELANLISLGAMHSGLLVATQKHLGKAAESCE